MRIRGAWMLVAGATGVRGAAVASRRHARGAAATVADRDRAAPARVAQACGDGRAPVFDVDGVARCAGTVTWAADELGGPDAVVAALTSAARPARPSGGATSGVVR
ncbi:hypothetical protein [Streptomyces sp. NPDC048643]|uniref:hypothetical protein n=1 Tax=Streptomyces sp. NPDC048643 TaxID=3155637 RepID=UPI003426A467